MIPASGDYVDTTGLLILRGHNSNMSAGKYSRALISKLLTTIPMTREFLSTALLHVVEM